MGQTKEQKILKQMSGGTVQKKTAIASDMFLPNHSGDHSAGHTSTPTDDEDIANKKYVDDKFPVTHASTTGQTTDDHHNESHSHASHTGIGVSDHHVKTVSSDITHNSTTGLNDGATYQHITTTQETNFQTAYDHSQDNTQAHSDYLLNNADDTSAFKLTLGALIVDKININDDDIYTLDAADYEDAEDINITGGDGGLSYGPPGTYGGSINLTAGAGGGFGPGIGGSITLEAGSGDVCGDINILGATGGATAGDIYITSRNSATNDLGEVHIRGTVIGGDAGVLYLQELGGGTVIGDNGAHAGIKVYVQGDDGGIVASPSVCQFLAGTARAATDGNDSIFEATNAGTGNQNGGDILFNAGALSGTGSNGNIIWGLANYKDINIGGYLLTRPASGAPDVVNFVDEAGADTAIPTYAFDVGEKVSGGFELQHDYEEGSDFVFHVHWQGIAAPTGTDNVQWRLTYILMRDGTTLNAAVTIDSPDTTFDTQYESVRTDFAAITGTTFLIGDQFMFTLERVAATGDAYAGDALIGTAGIHYKVNTLGSRTINAK